MTSLKMSRFILVLALVAGLLLAACAVPVAPAAPAGEAAAGEPLVDAGAGRPHPRVPAVDVAVQRQGEQACVQLVTIERAGVASKLCIVPARLDLGADRLPVRPELVHADVDLAGLVQLDEAVERDPAERLGVGVMEAAGPPLPDPLVRLAPASAHCIAQAVQ